MRWVTREHAKVDRIACPWLIRRFIDPDAEFLYVPAERVLAVAEEQAAISYDAPGARYGHTDAGCTFDTLVEAYGVGDPGVLRMAAVVRGADITGLADPDPAAAGLLAMASGFALLGLDDHRLLELESPMYDALHAWATAQVGAR